MKKTREELQKIREDKLNEISLRVGDNPIRVVVGLATCGIAAGASVVFNVMKEEIEKLSLGNVSIRQTGCIGACRLEPLVEVYEKNGNKTTYIKVDSEKAKRIVKDHLQDGKVIQEYVMTMIDGNIIDPVMKG